MSKNMKVYQLQCRAGILQIADVPIIMGVLNVTPDSFSDGGEYINADLAVARGLEMVGQGADIIDIGGESTRPGAQAVGADEQIRRVCGVIRQLAAQTDVPISIDTTSSKVAAAALEAGGAIVNDISALRGDEGMAALVAQRCVPVILMHMQGVPGDMQKNPCYVDVVGEVKGFLAERIEFALSTGIKRSSIIVDPGIGFGKTLEHNLLLMGHLSEFGEFDVPVLVGASRKSFIGKILDIEDPAGRVFGTAATVALAVGAGVQMLRVHDVAEMGQVAKVAAAIRDQRMQTDN